jgi:hypothetical protein
MLFSAHRSTVAELPLVWLSRPLLLGLSPDGENFHFVLSAYVEAMMHYIDSSSRSVWIRHDTE